MASVTRCGCDGACGALHATGTASGPAAGRRACRSVYRPSGRPPYRPACRRAYRPSGRPPGRAAYHHAFHRACRPSGRSSGRPALPSSSSVGCPFAGPRPSLLAPRRGHHARRRPRGRACTSSPSCSSSPAPTRDRTLSQVLGCQAGGRRTFFSFLCFLDFLAACLACSAASFRLSISTGFVSTCVAAQIREALQRSPLLAVPHAGGASSSARGVARTLRLAASSCWRMASSGSIRILMFISIATSVPSVPHGISFNTAASSREGGARRPATAVSACYVV